VTTERECIEHIGQLVTKQDNEFLLKGIGDDCAVIRKGDDMCLLLTTDTLVSGVHFDLSWHPPYLLGRKCISVNMSDIAAMGGKPYACLLTIGFPNKVPPWLDDFMKGFLEVLQVYDTLLIGGDTVMSKNDTVFSVTLLGEMDRTKVCYRSGAKAGDIIWVSGSLGNAAAGLELCRRGFYAGKDSAGKWQNLLRSHLDPEPHVELGDLLAASGFVHAMMDISDGLATDLAHLCHESGVGAEIEQALLPVDEILREAAVDLDRPSMDWVIRGGEDYQLLFTTEAAVAQKLHKYIAERSGRQIFPVGRIVEGQGVYLLNGSEKEEISFQGYEHFTK
jgi:thiamine-monophosphate kinase